MREKESELTESTQTGEKEMSVEDREYRQEEEKERLYKIT